MAGDSFPRSRSLPVRPLALGLCSVAIYAGGNVLVWAGRRHLHLETEAQVRLIYVVVAVYAVTFVATAVRVALRVRERALLAATAADLQAVEGIGALWARYIREGLSRLAEASITHYD